jgi:hypothetical protein
VQADLRGRRARGEQAVVPGKTTFEDIAEAWFANKRLRPSTRKAYRDSLDRVLLPKLDSKRVGEITVDEIVALIRAWEKQGLSRSSLRSRQAERDVRECDGAGRASGLHHGPPPRRRRMNARTQSTSPTAAPSTAKKIP